MECGYKRDILYRMLYVWYHDLVRESRKLVHNVGYRDEYNSKMLWIMDWHDTESDVVLIKCDYICNIMATLWPVDSPRCTVKPAKNTCLEQNPVSIDHLSQVDRHPQLLC